MGSGPSKDGQAEKRPVANVNKTSATVNASNNNNEREHEKSPKKPEPKSEQKTGKKSPVDVESKSGRTDIKRVSNWSDGPGSESDADDDLNEVLRVPTLPATDRRPPPAPKPQSQTVDYPETYAQRKQREQYTLNQQMLLRQKTIYRNPDDWQNEDDEVHGSSTGGFDPSKFRQVNKGSMTTRSTIFTTSEQDMETSYGHGQGELDEMDVTPRRSQVREVPVYNASEQDLMASLERELL